MLRAPWLLALAFSLGRGNKLLRKVFGTMLQCAAVLIFKIIINPFISNETDQSDLLPLTTEIVLDSCFSIESIKNSSSELSFDDGASYIFLTGL